MQRLLACVLVLSWSYAAGAEPAACKIDLDGVSLEGSAPECRAEADHREAASAREAARQARYRHARAVFLSVAPSVALLALSYAYRHDEYASHEIAIVGGAGAGVALGYKLADLATQDQHPGPGLAQLATGIENLFVYGTLVGGSAGLFGYVGAQLPRSARLGYSAAAASAFSVTTLSMTW